MTYYAEPGKVPYDEWFDDNINPLDLMPIATEDGPMTSDPDTIHEKMYRLAVGRKGGGSEGFIKNYK
tara:strand:- start:2651 stop:2851 length:201 start_codon:yes stop_codon:yes gene_type:complete